LNRDHAPGYCFIAQFTGKPLTLFRIALWEGAMLAALTVRDIVLIENAALEFAPGLNVLTGETGAGKSILLDSLGLAVGYRGRAAVRPGAAQGMASALFEPPPDHPARAFLAAQGLGPAEGGIVLRRTLASDGRSRAFANDAPVGVGLLKDLGGLLLEVHGQADDRGLFDVATHRALLDGFGGHEGALEEVAKRYGKYEAACQAAQAVRRAADAAAADADYVRHAADELQALGPEEGEEERLATQRALLLGASRIAEDIAAVSDLLAGERGAENALAAALKKLSRMTAEARPAAAPALAALEQAFAFAEEGRRELDALQTRLEFEPGALEKTDDRLYALRAASRKYGVPCDGLVRVLAEFLARREMLDGGSGALRRAEAEVEAARAAYRDAAASLSQLRAAAARRLESAVAAELEPLKLGHAKFRVTLAPLDEESAYGMERVAFEVATVQGAGFGSLAKVASGGELARFSLALKVALAQRGPTAVLVFEEVDRGVGGAVADAVGLRLQALAQTTQVLLVTHSPQVAARAARHFRITRNGDKTRIELLTDAARLEEIARMLSGAAVTDEARGAARRLLAEAALPVRKNRKRA
jgi:DNA repair protein RecN (Recombination protein N)